MSKTVEKIKALIIKYREIILYIIVGGLTTVVDWLIFTALNLLLPSLPFITDAAAALSLTPDTLISDIGNTLGWAGAVVFAFFANKYLVFTGASGSSGVQFLKFVASRVLTLVLTIAFNTLFIELLSMNEYLSKAIISVVVVVLNYITGKFLVFVKRKKDAESGEEAQP